MFIFKVKTRSNSAGGSYFTHRIIESRRVGKKSQQEGFKR